MNPRAITEVLEAVQRGELSVDAATAKLKLLPFADLGFARVDHHRELRNGLPEVVFGEGKSAEQIATIATHMVENGRGVLVTRVDVAKADKLGSTFPGLRYNPVARTLRVGQGLEHCGGTAKVAVVTAGTSDQTAAEECLETLEYLGVEAVALRDVGVAGIQRLFDGLTDIGEVSVFIVVAGMEGALPSVLGGLVDVPVIAVPTSVGYGASFGGLSALLAMMNSCVAGVTVVNIDNGFGAAAAAYAIVNLAGKSCAKD